MTSHEELDPDAYLKQLRQLKQQEQFVWPDAAAMPPIDPAKVKKGKEQPPDDAQYKKASEEAAKRWRQPPPPPAPTKGLLSTVLDGRADRKRDRAIIQAHKAQQQQSAQSKPRQQRPRHSHTVDPFDGLYTGPRTAHDNNDSAYHDPATNSQPAATGCGCSSTIMLLLALAALLFALYICLCNCG